MNIAQFSSLVSTIIFALANLVGDSIYLLTLFLWLLPLFRQAKGRFFYYFFILAVSQSIVLIFYYFWKLPPFYIFTIFSYLLSFTIFGYDKLWKKNLLILNTILLLVVLIHLHNYANYVAALYHIQLLGYFIALFLKKYFTHDIIHIYICLLVVYEFSTILMFSLRFVHSRINVIFANILSLFELFICVFFIVYDFNNSPKIRLSRQRTVENA
jgi:hypothetical protein